MKGGGDCSVAATSFLLAATGLLYFLFAAEFSWKTSIRPFVVLGMFGLVYCKADEVLSFLRGTNVFMGLENVLAVL